jgi:hypothetical protein
MTEFLKLINFSTEMMSNDITLRRANASGNEGFLLAGNPGDKRHWDAENKLVEC